MLKQHSDIIVNNLNVLVEQTNLEGIVPILEEKGVFSNVMLQRLLDPSRNEQRQKTDVYLALVKRGPQAFQSLLDALTESGQESLARMLRQGSFTRSSSLNSVGSSSNSSLNDVEMEGGAWSLSKRSEDLTDDSPPDRHEGNVVPLNLPAYTGNLTQKLQSMDLAPDAMVNLRTDEEQMIPVQVTVGQRWQSGPAMGPGSYRVETNPRGLALVITNIDFTTGTWPRRNGAQNDAARAEQCLHQLGMQVSPHLNKTRQEMNDLLRDFSSQAAFKKVDCCIVVMMSHGQEGDSEEDTEIVGVDGAGLKVRDIISRFYHDACPALVGKPKIFIFQSCRGILLDPGVRVGAYPQHHRTETDGIGKMRKVRSISDVFIAYAVPPGRTANRDIYTGGWFIQAVVDIFCQYAHALDLDDMIKLVDTQVQRSRTAGEFENHQTITTKTLGWNKKFYFNPGLDRRRARSNGVDEGMDVVDCKSNKKQYHRLPPSPDSNEEEGCFSGARNKCNPC